MAVGGSGFLGRWSRLKAETRSKAPEPPAQTDAITSETDAVPSESDAAPSESDAAPPPDLPDIESLGKDSDYTVFLQDGVPDEIRNLALRKLWLSDPEFNVVDGLDDYDEDFRTIEEIAEQLAKLGKDKDGGDGAARKEPEADETPPPQDGDQPTPEAPSPQTASDDEEAGDDNGDETSGPA